ncbi:MAG: hypothetical protein BWY78_00588 [Alphaproteobacteria bacterium ADurb.Bin438]|nr:MAG: hypothetical protein BWY78_00588 [Alphaproteobacteria bacterium ADurb.Bin438]
MEEIDNKRQDFKLGVVKIIVFVLSGLIFVCGSLIIYGAIKFQNKKIETVEINAKTIEKSFELENGTFIKSSFSCGKHLCVNVKNDKDQEKIFIINPDNLSDIKTLKFY